MPSRPASHRAGGLACGSVDSAAATYGSRLRGIPSRSAWPSSTRKKIVWKLPATERLAPGRRVRHRGTPGVHVGRAACRTALDHLRRQVAGRAHHEAGLGQPGRVGHVRDAEVDDHRVPAVEHDVARLEVAVHHAGRVDGGQRLGKPLGQAVERRAAQRSHLAHHLLQRPAGDVPGDDVGRAAGHVGVDHLGDEPVPDPAHGLHLAGQALPGVRVAGHGRAEHLDRDPAPVRVRAKVDNAHTALADLRRPGGRGRSCAGANPVRAIVLSG